MDLHARLRKLDSHLMIGAPYKEIVDVAAFVFQKTGGERAGLYSERLSKKLLQKSQTDIKRALN